MKVSEHTDMRNAAHSSRPVSDREVLERLEVPDDLSGLAAIPRIGEPGGVPADEPPRSASTVRWLRWLAVLALAVAGTVIAVSLNSDGGSSDSVPAVDAPPNWEVDGPGSHSLDVPLLALTETPWATSNDGPGGHSLNVVAVPVAPAATPVIGFDWEVDGPGSHSLDVPLPAPTETPWAITNDGPGGNSLNVVDP